MSLNEIYDPENILAKIVRGDIPSTRVYEDHDTLAIMDIFPQSDGHMLVIHKRAAATNIIDVEPDDLLAIMKTVQRLAAASVKALGPDGVRIAQFNGNAAGQTIFQLHVHIIPVFQNAPVKSHAGEAANPAHLKSLALKISAALQSEPAK